MSPFTIKKVQQINELRLLITIHNDNTGEDFTVELSPDEIVSLYKN